MKKVIRRPDYPIVETRAGCLHGYVEDDVFHFKGIQYGRAKRFEPAVPAAWEGIRSAAAYGYCCPLLPEEEQDPEDRSRAPFNSFEMPHVYWPMNEQCLYLNIWTRHLKRNAGKPVLVWLHGGGYCAGSSIELPAYDGKNLCSDEDVVVVTLNHRLNCIGFLDLSSFGEEYRFTGILGMMDIVLALQWIRDNIAAFGGDPENVTVAGQSGGGGKAAALLQMPIADGLYHRIVIQSGTLDSPEETVAAEKKRWQRLGEKTAELLGLTKETIDEIRTIPYERLAKACVDAGQALGMPGGMMLTQPSPTEDVYIGSYDQCGFREETRSVPVLAGNVLGEFSFRQVPEDKERYTWKEKKRILEKRFGGDTEEIVRLFKACYPDKDILYALSTDTLFRPNTLRFVSKRAAFTDAPVYLCMMSVIIPYLGGVVPWHCADIPYVFRNVESEPMHCAGVGYREQLEAHMSAAFAGFIRSSDPSSEDLPWDVYTEKERNCMRFDEVCGMTRASESELLQLLARHAYGL